MIERTKCNIRSLREEDLPKVLAWRNSDRIRANMYNDHLITLEEHSAWFQRIQQDRNSQHLIFEYDDCPVGVINITQIDPQNNKCYWGFYLGETDTPRGCGLAMGYLGLNHIFGRSEIRKLCAEALVFNVASINYHRKLGLLRRLFPGTCIQE